jgi:hypothetical protein
MRREYADNFYDMDNASMEYDEPNTNYRPLENIWDNPEDIEKENSTLTIEDLIQIIDTELNKLEYNRDSIEFYYKDELVEATPMAKLGNSAAVFKIDNKLKKIKFKDISFDY